MNAIEGMLIGAVAVALGMGLFFGLRKALQVATGLTTALKGIPELIACLKQLILVQNKTLNAANALGAELQYLRGVANQGQAVVEADYARSGGVATQPPPVIPPFPPPVWDRYPVQRPVPDAKTEETDLDLLNQTDADLAQIEHIENLRQQGMIIEEPPEQPVGVMVESE